jgi:hypothetical protein
MGAEMRRSISAAALKLLIAFKTSTLAQAVLSARR